MAETLNAFRQVLSERGWVEGRNLILVYRYDSWRDYEQCKAKGVEFVRPPKEEPYGVVAVFKDLYGNLWDLLQPKG